MSRNLSVNVDSKPRSKHHAPWIFVSDGEAFILDDRLLFLIKAWQFTYILLGVSKGTKCLILTKRTTMVSIAGRGKSDWTAAFNQSTNLIRAVLLPRSPSLPSPSSSDDEDRLPASSPNVQEDTHQTRVEKVANVRTQWRAEMFSFGALEDDDVVFKHEPRSLQPLQ